MKLVLRQRETSVFTGCDFSSLLKAGAKEYDDGEGTTESTEILFFFESDNGESNETSVTTRKIALEL